MKYLPINSELFIYNRSLLANKIKNDSIAIFNSNDIMPTNSDGTMPFKQNSDLFWLTGIDQEESVFAIVKKNEKISELLFVKETNEHIAIWEGAKLSKELAKKKSGVQNVFWLSEMEKILSKEISATSKIYLNKNIHSRAAKVVQTRDDRYREGIQQNFPNKEILEVATIMHELRFVKSKHEIDLMQKACDITEKGLRRILPIIKPGIMEYEIEAELMHEFLSNRSTGFAYQPIIGSGADSCVLHYVENNKKCLDGDVLLMDFGAEYANYTSDLTRTVPVNGVFNDRQRKVYAAVHRVMKEATNMLRPGTDHKKMQQEVVKIMEEELIGLKLFDRLDVKNQDPNKTHKVLQFQILKASVRAYKNNLNTHNAYSEFREKRAQLREEDKTIIGLDLVKYLKNYAAIGDKYVEILKIIIETNSLTDFDKANLLPTRLKRGVAL